MGSAVSHTIKVPQHFIEICGYCYNILVYNIILFRFVSESTTWGSRSQMKLELGMRSQEIQRDWYGKHSISLHGFYVIAQLAVRGRRVEVFGSLV